MKDKYRDNKIDGVANDFKYDNNDTNNKKDFSFKNFLIISLLIMFFISVILNIILISSKNSDNIYNDTIQNNLPQKEINIIINDINKNETKIDSLNYKLDLYFQNTKRDINEIKFLLDTIK